MAKKKKLAIIGGGASGLACAIEAARIADNRVEITIYEAGVRVGKKLLGTGNGRCNMLNINACAEDYHGDSAFAKYALDIFTPQDNIEFFNSIGLYTKTEDDGRVYPLSNQAAGVLDALRFAVDTCSVNTVCECCIEEITPLEKGFMLNNKYYADAVVVAAGGKVPCSKADKCNAHELLKKLGHNITPLLPSLVQLITKETSVKALKGLRADVTMTLTAGSKLLRKEQGELLFTDYGLSGIVSMQLSGAAARFINSSGKKPIVYIDFAPDFSFEELRKAINDICRNLPTLEIENLLSGFMAKRIGQMIVKECGFVQLAMPVSKLSQRDVSALCSAVKSFAFTVNGVRDFAFAQVTAGGADTAQFNDETMESRLYKNLYCAGEVLDVDGDCGGYNLQWAWSSGRLAAQSAVKELIGN